MSDPIRVGNISGMFGDRPGAAAEMLQDPDVAVLTGDWLAELTMLILARTRMRRPDGGFGRTFLDEMESTMGTCLDRSVKVVVNAGGLDPLGCADAVNELADRLGLTPCVAAVTGDDLMARLDDLMADGERFTNLDTGEELGERRGELLVANAYLGGWGIVEALARGADIVVTGRVTDAAVVLGPAAWHHGWERTDWNRLAGAVVAGHVIECSTQATGGNYSFFTEIPDMVRPGFPWADIAADGSSVIGKPDGTGGEVSIGTVTSQLLYEIAGPSYLNADVSARFDSIRLRQVGEDRVAIEGVLGEPPPDTLKVSMAYAGGFRNSLVIGLTGLDADEKISLLEQQVWDASPWPREDYDEVSVTHIGGAHADPHTNAAAISLLEFAVADRDEDKVGRRWSNALANLALGSIPGLFGLFPPGPGRPFAHYWPSTIARSRVMHTVHMGGETVDVPETAIEGHFEAPIPAPEHVDPPGGDTLLVPLGLVVGARSGDKGGSANLGVFVRSDDAWGWLDHFLTVERLTSLLPDLAGHTITRHRFANLRALNFVIEGLLGRGVSSSLRVDPQAKGLGEYLRARLVDVPASLVE